MVRWRCCLVLAMLLLLPVRLDSKSDDEDEDDRGDDADDDNDDTEDDDDDDEQTDKLESVGRRAPALIPTPNTEPSITRTSKKRPLECYVCAYKAETPLRACLDPTKYRVHTITCHSLEDRCFTSVISKGNTYEAVVRGCRSGCVGSTDTTCCELNRCNNQAFTMPVLAPRVLTSSNKAANPIPPNVVVFVTVLLVLQTVVKVTFV
ncbi:hypothetical protein K1T71_008384 [Dendrolimus kikuchii]|uniref:Uncharacterized protein n=1 Tax=Dendrolimus kikuchii TaxID=765133 RepID=A0ACC1CXL0_9NEOP|nr:hypothetical protein K1T71_008384 [Dendrolimus kikuchii]